MPQPPRLLIAELQKDQVDMQLPNGERAIVPIEKLRDYCLHPTHRVRSIVRPMRFTAGRNQVGLTEKQIAYCMEAWAVLCADRPIAFETSEAVQYTSRTRCNEVQNIVFLGAVEGQGGTTAATRLRF